MVTESIHAGLARGSSFPLETPNGDIDRKIKRHEGLAIWFTLDNRSRKHYTDMLRGDKRIQNIINPEQGNQRNREMLLYWTTPLVWHVTLSSSLMWSWNDDVFRRVGGLAENIWKMGRIEFNFNNIDYDLKRGSLFVEAEETGRLRDIYNFSYDELGRGRKESYRPHLSISYVYRDGERAKEMIAEIKRQGLDKELYGVSTVKKLRLSSPMLRGTDSKFWDTLAIFDISNPSMMYGKKMKEFSGP